MNRPNIYQFLRALHLKLFTKPSSWWLSTRSSYFISV